VGAITSFEIAKKGEGLSKAIGRKKKWLERGTHAQKGEEKGGEKKGRIAQI